MTPARRAGAALAACLVVGAAAAPWLAPNPPDRQHADHGHAPPMRVRLLHEGRLRAPFVYPVRLVSRLERRFEADRTRPVPVRWFAGGRLASVDAPGVAWLPLGGDPLGRDVLARLLHGARASLAVTAVATLLALLLGAAVGGAAGQAGGRLDGLLMRATDLVLVLPVIYIVLVLRAAMPLVLSPWQVFWTLAGVFALAGWPYPARVVRAVVAAERRKEYAESAVALGAGRWRILLRHLLPAARGAVAVQAVVLAPAFVLAEATLSFVGFGFAEPFASWGVMLQDAARVAALAEAPWLLAPAGAIVLTVLALQLLHPPPITKP